MGRARGQTVAQENHGRTASRRAADLSFPPLLTRAEFREAVFARDEHRCVHCGAVDVKLDAHHLMERRLWDDGGYYIDNGVSLCEPCHLRAESTDVSPDELRQQAGIAQVLLPEHLVAGETYTKWGDIVLADGRRMPGELFADESVQKALTAGDRDHLGEYSRYVKYPRTYHLPWSDCAASDDKTLPDLSGLQGREIVMTEKADGENATIYADGYFHARSLDGRAHPSQAWIKALAAQIGPQLPDGWRISGENLYAQHAIAYDKLPSYFLVFAIYDENNQCLSWDDTEEWAELLDLPTVPVLYRGPFDEKTVRSQWDGASQFGDVGEGYVLRRSEPFAYSEHRQATGKYVRADHVPGGDDADGKHWSTAAITPNELAN